MRTKCAICGQRFDEQRDSRRWKAEMTPVGGQAAAKPRAAIVCTECFLELVESEYGAS